jgi:hypothetical protein
MADAAMPWRHFLSYAFDIAILPDADVFQVAMMPPRQFSISLSPLFSFASLLFSSLLFLSILIFFDYATPRRRFHATIISPLFSSIFRCRRRFHAYAFRDAIFTAFLLRCCRPPFRLFSLMLICFRYYADFAFAFSFSFIDAATLSLIFASWLMPC